MKKPPEPPKPRYATKAAEDTIGSGAKFEKFAEKKLNPFGITTWTFGGRHEQLTIGENSQGVEYKFDGPCSGTKQLSIELYEKSDPRNIQWVPSGILREDNAWLYVQGNEDIIFVFSKKWLRRVYRRLLRVKPQAIRVWPPPPEETVKSFFLKFKDAHRGAALVIDARTGKRWAGDDD